MNNYIKSIKYGGFLACESRFVFNTLENKVLWLPVI